jgi:hypothetical protein
MGCSNAALFYGPVQADQSKGQDCENSDAASSHSITRDLLILSGMERRNESGIEENR